jgi:hypothetical protein
MLDERHLGINENTQNAGQRSLQHSKNDIRAILGSASREAIVRCSAFNTVSRVLGRPLHSIPEDVATLRGLIADADPAAGDIRPSTWRSRRSSVFTSLALLGHHTLSGRSRAPCSADMRALLDRLPPRPHCLQLTPLTGWLIENGLSFANFDQNRSEPFRADMKRRKGERRGQKIYLQAVNMFNKCRQQFPEFWPQISIEPRYDFDTYTYAKSSFSAAFNKDVDDMIADSLKPPLGRRSGRKPIRQSTAKQRRATVYRIASIIARQKGISPATFTSLADIVDPEAFDNALDFIIERVGEEKTGDIYRVARTITTIAKHWVKVPDAQLEELKNIRGNVYPGDGPAQKTMELLRLFKNPRLQEEFLLKPDMIMANLKRKRAKTRNDAVKAEVATCWRVLSAVPARSINAVTFCEGENYFRFGSGRNQIARIHIPGDQTKNEQPLDLLVPREADLMVHDFMKLFRPLLGAGQPGQLCPGRGGKPKKASLLSQQLAKMTSAELGVRMTAHQWRHVVGYIYLSRNPGCYEPVRRLLGHRSIETTQKYYAFMLNEDAQEAIDETFERVRQEGRLRLKRGARNNGVRHA